ncbi:hypothetical protein CS542_01240 [Pedobacter sp. IW39]|nr:hypothetical protein CS542_01240 [Pedobacter sp. IW39]
MIGGYTKNGYQQTIQFLLVGVFDDGKLFIPERLGRDLVWRWQQLLTWFEPLLIAKPVFTDKPDLIKLNRSELVRQRRRHSVKPS